MKNSIGIWVLFGVWNLFFAGCASSDIFSDIGTNLASPLTITINSATGRAYLNNSNSRVEYDWRQGSLHVLDITTPTSPTLVQSVGLDSFSGEMYLDTTNNRLLISNRLSADDADTTDTLYSINTDETSANFLTATSITVAKDPFGIACCDSSNRLLMASLNNVVQYFDVSGSLSAQDISLPSTLDDGATLSSSRTTFVAINGDNAYVSRDNGGVFILDLTEVGTSNPVNYLISDIINPRGLVVSDGKLYVATRFVDSGTIKNQILVLNLSALPAATSDVQNLDMNDDGLLVKQIDVGEDPKVVVAGTSKIYVSNQDSDTVSVIDPTTNPIGVTHVAVGEKPFGMAILKDLNGTPGDTSDDTDTHLFVCNVKSNTVSVIRLSDNAIVGTYP